MNILGLTTTQKTDSWNNLNLYLRGDTMSDYINLTCPSCGGKLQITNDVDRFACGYCGHELIVKRGGGIISLSPMVEELKEVKTGVDKTASELTIVRISE